MLVCTIEMNSSLSNMAYGDVVKRQLTKNCIQEFQREITRNNSQLQFIPTLKTGRTTGWVLQLDQTHLQEPAA